MKLIAKITLFFMLITPLLALAANYADDHAVKGAPLSMVIHNDHDDDHHHGYSHTHDGVTHTHDGHADHDHENLDLHHVYVSIYALPVSHTLNVTNGTNERTFYFTSLYKNKITGFPDRPPIS